MTQLTGKRILLGVTGGIAAYKAAELTRLLKTAGVEVRVVMTDAATAFVGPLTFQALSGNPVHTGLLDPAEESAMGHISLARWADLLLIAPATADFMARLRAGLAGDLLAALCLAAECPIALAPAMNRAMWDNPATRENLQVIEGRGMRVLGPAQGEQACGETGWGRMLEPAEIVEQLALGSASGPLAGLKVLVSAGPTREPIDPVRFISNRSSGKMGYAVAAAAAAAGARVLLVSGPVALEAPRGVDRVAVESAEDMRLAVFRRIGEQDIYIGAAAVADYTPAVAEERKIKKNDERISLQLARTRDILAEVAALPNPPFTVGFAAETHGLEDYARGKLQSKRLDMIAANLVGQAEGGFDSELNALQVFWNGGSARLEMASKQRVGAQLVELIAKRFHAKNTA
ncbi:bifunctional phosphopantothenoylcysteine decarboxylase/phosphopantothenate--cysteine ligase CoaBC [Methyloterricola oryzae]|uniref:bifunctional phosphopantothenoylcysteine decarboxylase/phosphopantothenate--cysteine ligase CoaBC n=1 Tax=Methyloterricola oryzae TaxID=1495050 RepID=UPI0005EAE8FD|nr:bifunctional phosphopantothenoylcysteine decarboxylase/phosphopantothenate--cysteine ligase CoaBC [Methyloterricola oryzae]